MSTCSTCTNRFSFLGSGSPIPVGNASRNASRHVPNGFWTMVLESDKIVYLRGTQGSRVFSKFEVPFGASYACGNNTHNVFQRNRNETNNVIVLSAIQVSTICNKLRVYLHVHCMHTIIIYTVVQCNSACWLVVYIYHDVYTLT